MQSSDVRAGPAVVFSRPEAYELQRLTAVVIALMGERLSGARRERR